MNLILSLGNSAAMMAALAMIYGLVQRTPVSRFLRHLVLGLCFGLGASLAMLQPVPVSEGVFIDGRSLFIGFSAAFLGPIGVVAALAAGSVSRLMIGGDGMFLGIASMLIAAAAGLGWLGLRRHCRMPDIVCYMALGILLTLSLAVIVFLPSEIRQEAVKTVPGVLIYDIVGSVVLGSLLQRERDRTRVEREIRADAITDPLTGLLNRRALDQTFSSACSTQSAKGSGLLLIDLDHFKSVNDRHGHDAGDAVLRQTGRALRQAVRQDDTVIRLGGEEFVVVLPNVTEQEALQAAWRICENLRMAVPLSSSGQIRVSASVGGVHWRQVKGTVDAVLKQADQSLYDAKNAGRNTVVMRRLQSQSRDPMRQIAAATA